MSRHARGLSAGALLAGYIADLVAGDPRRLHPVAGFGTLAAALERAAYAPRRTRGALCTGTLVAFAAAVAALGTRAARRIGIDGRVFAALVAWAALGGRSLAGEARAVAGALERGDIDAARTRLVSLCGRDAEQLDEAGVARAVVESVAENTGDAVVGALAWGALAGAPGVAAYRAANTLDAMFGHRNERYERFGWAAARLDDALSWPGARLGAALAALLAPLVGGSSRAAWQALRRDGAAHPSPNAGRLEAAFAGALGVRLGGEVVYGGARQQRPRIGASRRPADVGDIARAVRLSLAVGAASAATCALAAHARDGVLEALAR